MLLDLLDIKKTDDYSDVIKRFNVEYDIFKGRALNLRINNSKQVLNYKREYAKFLKQRDIDSIEKLLVEIKTKNSIMNSYFNIINFPMEALFFDIKDVDLIKKNEFRSICGKFTILGGYSQNISLIAKEVNDAFNKCSAFRFCSDLTNSKEEIKKTRNLIDRDILSAVFDKDKIVIFNNLDDALSSFIIIKNCIDSFRSNVSMIFETIDLGSDFSNNKFIENYLIVKRDLIMNKIDSYIAKCKKKAVNYVDLMISLLKVLEDLREIENEIEDLNKPLFDALSLSADDSEVVLDATEYFNYSVIQRYKRNIIGDGQIRDIPDYEIEQFIDRVNERLYTLTEDQVSAIWSAFEYLRSNKRTNCLIQGDVSSGKTIVSIALFFIMSQCGYKCLYIVPRKALRIQHYNSLMSYKKKLGYDNIKVANFDDGFVSPDIIVCGASVKNKKFDHFEADMAIVDEIQLLGVEDRNSVQNRYENIEMFYTTATPNPRTKMIIKLGDMDIIEIKKMPPGRKSKITGLFSEDGSHGLCSSEVYDHIVEQKKLDPNNLCLVVCPLKKKADDQVTPFENVYNCYKKYSEMFPDLNVVLFDSGYNDFDKEDILIDANNGKIDILITTKVIEVGIDIKNATTILIYGTPGGYGYGVSTLHQLRGRVGRNDKQGYCFLYIHEDFNGIPTNYQYILDTDDVFELSLKDFDNRGFERIIGFKQSGNSNSSNKERNKIKFEVYSKISDNVDLFLENLNDDIRVVLDELASKNTTLIN